MPPKVFQSYRLIKSSFNKLAAYLRPRIIFLAVFLWMLHMVQQLIVFVICQSYFMLYNASHKLRTFRIRNMIHLTLFLLMQHYLVVSLIITRHYYCITALTSLTLTSHFRLRVTVNFTVILENNRNCVLLIQQCFIHLMIIRHDSCITRACISHISIRP